MPSCREKTLAQQVGWRDGPTIGDVTPFALVDIRPDLQFGQHGGVREIGKARFDQFELRDERRGLDEGPVVFGQAVDSSKAA